MSFRRLFYGLFFCATGIVVSYFVLFPNVWHCLNINHSDFRKVNQKIYISPEITNKQLRQASENIKNAQNRIEEFWGSYTINPTIILCQTTAQYQRYCSSNEGAGCSLGTPWGTSYIVLNLDGINTDVIAHEMCHDELYNRLGWWKTTRQIPQWFNEGLALMVDYRFVLKSNPAQRLQDYRDETQYISGGGQIALTLSEIASLKGFFGGNNGHVMLAYMTAGAEVARWLSIVGDKHVATFVQQIADGAEFDTLYNASQKKLKSPDTKSAE